MNRVQSALDGAFDPPALPADVVADIAATWFGIVGGLTELRGEREQNTLITTSSGTRFVLKLAAVTDTAAIDFQCAALEHIARVDWSLPVPRVVRHRSATYASATHVTADVGAHGTVLARVLTFLPGHTFDDAGTVPADALRAIGALQASLAAALAEFDHPAADAHMPWALDSGSLDDPMLWSGLDDDARELAGPCRHRVGVAVGAMAGLPRQVIHNDAHRGNLLRGTADDQDVTGIIDFGDLVRSARVADLAVSGASFLGPLEDPIAGLIEMVSGYQRVAPLRDEEIALLPELVMCRMVLSTLMTDYQRRHSPHIAAVIDAERPGVLANLARWNAIDPSDAIERLHDGLAASTVDESDVPGDQVVDDGD